MKIIYENFDRGFRAILFEHESAPDEWAYGDTKKQALDNLKKLLYNRLKSHTNYYTKAITFATKDESWRT